jgi:hypothetical protein
MNARRSVPLSTSRRRRVFAPFSIAPTSSPRRRHAPATTFFFFLFSFIPFCDQNVSAQRNKAPSKPMNSRMYRPIRPWSPIKKMSCTEYFRRYPFPYSKALAKWQTYLGLRVGTSKTSVELFEAMEGSRVSRGLLSAVRHCNRF